MKFKLDENMPAEACAVLAKAGYDAHTVLHEEMGGQPDSMISSVCQSEARILITLDTDFCNILNYPPETHPGIIVIRTMDQSKSSVLGFIERILTAIETEEVERRLWIVQQGGIRIR
ncbi:DUF5615 family PIN-like protein [Pontiellaceae bacterium B12227]|nr:DUF5615 family PIN-like protein [Pontiellaceae bacterium B12227]